MANLRTAADNTATLNSLQRTTERGALRKLLNEHGITWKEKKRGLAWLDTSPTLNQLTACKKNLLAMLTLRRDALAQLDRRGKEAYMRELADSQPA